jgi:cell division protein FtsW (lipid II flippase)
VLDTYYKEERRGHFSDGTRKKVARPHVPAALMRFGTSGRTLIGPCSAPSIVLSAISLIEIYSATTKNLQFESNAAFRQLMWICIGIRFCCYRRGTGLSHDLRQIPWLYLAGIGVLLYTHGIGSNSGGFQKLDRYLADAVSTSELVKDLVIVAAARVIFFRTSQRRICET